ncbi:MAG: type III-B CRISPR module RAMP protein Cmr4 [Paraglaciecola sp.]|nr:type III-B CRISPR module RAMP protein Cmr4 [Paraglaciecola sp.]
MYSNAILGLTAQTFIHAGASSSEAAIDLPIQREAHTDWPVIFGSGMKGALRSHFEALALQQNDINAIFGPDTNNAAEHAGALLVSDARLVLLPVRSMTSHVKWVSCPAVLKRLQKDLTRMGMTVLTLPDFSKISANKALSAQGSGAVYLEEFCFETQIADLNSVLELLTFLGGEDLKTDFTQNLMIVSDDQFRLLCRSAVPVQAHIAIDSATKTVKNGALWYEENLPPESLMYCCLACTSGRDQNKTGANELLTKLKTGFEQKGFMQVGGNLTTGMGWFQVTWQGAQE